MIKCPNCGNHDIGTIIGIEYAYGHANRYDGVSEWRCEECGTRWGRWTGKILKEGECEERFGGQ